MTLSYMSSMVMSRRTVDRTNEQQIRELHNVCSSLELSVTDTGAALANTDSNKRRHELRNITRQIDWSINQLKTIRETSFQSNCDRLLEIATTFKNGPAKRPGPLTASLATELESAFKAFEKESLKLPPIPATLPETLTTSSRIASFVTVASFVAAAAAAFHILSRVSTSLNRIKDNCLRFRSDLPLVEVEGTTEELHTLDKKFRQLFDTISNLVQAERALLENSRDCIFSLDKDGKFITFNPATSELLGEVNARNIKSLTATDQTSKIIELLETSQRSAEPQRSILSLNNTESGLQHPVEATIQWAPQDETYFVIARDITKEQEIEKLKSEFFNRMNSQLTDPLRTLEETVAQFLQGQHGQLNDKGRATLVTAQSSLVRLIQLLRDLQCLSQMERCELAVNPRSVDIAAVLTEAVAEMTPFAAAKGISLSVEANHDQVSIDHGRIIQVLINLLSNAVKFSERNTKVKVCSIVTANSLQISVEDEGRGIAMEDFETLFERFQQTRASDSLMLGGSGLGLYVCKGIVEQHGGTIEVFSQPARGTKFLIVLPGSVAI